jgi:hypothetical protein
MNEACIYLFRVCIIAISAMAMSCNGSAGTVEKGERIRPDSENPFYWQYKGKLVLLLGGTWQDNLFNHPEGQAEHLDLLVSAGGNYVRNTMSHRNKGNVFAYHQAGEGIFDLDRFNDEYWQRFSDFLGRCYQRDILVQIEIWDPWDYYADHQSFGGWSYQPFNPANNVNYTADESGLPAAIEYNPGSEPSDHPFFRTVPSLENNVLVLDYQGAFVDKLLSVSLQFPNVLYCISNENGERLEWSDHWAGYLKMHSENAGLELHITEMRRNEDIRAADHHLIYDNPELYTFLDISQNNAWHGLGQSHYENIMYVRNYISGRPRPINNIKNYGAARHGEDESVARFCRIIFGGCAGSRFHRPHPLEDPDSHQAFTGFGLGLSPLAQKVILSIRQLTDGISLVTALPRNDLLSDREENEAYLLAESGRQYALYFPGDAGDGNIELDLTAANGPWRVKWVNITMNTWLEDEQLLQGGSTVQIRKPDNGHWGALILPFRDPVN